MSVILVRMHIEVQVPGTCNKGCNLDIVLVNAWSMVVVHVLMRDEKKEISKQDQTNSKAKQHSIPKAVTFPKKNLWHHCRL